MHIPNFVRSSAKLITSSPAHVRVNPDRLAEFAKWVIEHKDYDQLEASSLHPTSQEFSLEELAKFYFVVDTLNFCFWHNGMEYHDLVRFVKDWFVSEPELFTAKGFREDGQEYLRKRLRGLFIDERGQLDERVRLVRETLEVVEGQFGGSYLEVVKRAGFDAVKLMGVLTAHWVGFQDHSVYRGRQVGFYKRGQILVGDLKEALLAYRKSGQVRSEAERAILEAMPEEGISRTKELTGFPDYRVPQVLREFGVLEYSKELADLVDAQKDVPAGSEMELEIRGSNIECLVRLAEATKLAEIQIDWILWQWGEKNLDKIKPHHRTLTIFY